MSRFRGLLRPAIAVGGICGVIHAAALFLLVLTTENMSVMLWSPGPFFVPLLVLSLAFCGLSAGGTYLAAALGIPLPIPTVV